MTEVKICGITCEEEIRVINSLHIEYVGFVFVQKSKRKIDPKVCKALMSELNSKTRSVALFANGSSSDIEAVLKHADCDYIQLHGAETAEHVGNLRKQFGKPIIKALGISDTSDLHKISDYAPTVDKLLFDSKPKIKKNLPGGSGRAFNWKVLTGQVFPVPWMLAGGLNSDNIGNALKLLSPDCVDVSSGVEESYGKKSLEKVASFVNKVRNSDYAK